MKHLKILSRAKIGRQLSFNRNEALTEAMLLFWQHGYEATALSDLTIAMGVTPPSIYAAYGAKKKLFFEAVELYLSRPVTAKTLIEDASNAKGAAFNLLKGSALGFTEKNTAAGCLLASSAISCSN